MFPAPEYCRRRALAAIAFLVRDPCLLCDRLDFTPAFRPAHLLVLTLGLGLHPAAAAIDLDGDGMSDVWQADYPQTKGAPDADPDGDGWTNLAENFARTNPGDPNSVLRLGISNEAGESGKRLTWHGQAGVRYQVQQSDGLAGWTSLDGESVGAGTDAMTDVADGAGSSRFWQLMALGGAADADGDWLDAWEEQRLGSDPANADSDGDGIPDGKDFAYLAGPTVYSPAGLGIPASGPHAGKLVRYNKVGAAVAVRVFGVNYYDGFLRYIKDGNDHSFVAGFQYLKEHNIPVARVMIGGFWPADWNLYFNNKTEYYRRLDDFVEQAEKNGIGLIPVLFWHIATVGDVVQDAVEAGFITPDANAAATATAYDFVPPNPLNVDKDGAPTYDEYRKALAHPTSGTRALITYVTEEVVNRYKGSPAIWSWEFSNELNLSVDLPDPKPNRPTVLVQQKMNLARDDSSVPPYQSEDDLKRADVQAAKEHFAATVRALDPWRFISSGDSRQRPAAYNNWQTQTWGLSTRAQLAQVLPIDNPAGYGTVSIHFYANEETYFPASDPPVVTLNFESGTNPGSELPDYKNFLNFYMGGSAAISKILFVGEWGAKGNGTTQAEKDTFHSLMQALIDEEVQLSLLWTFDNRNTQQTTQWWVNPGTAKEYQLTNSDPNLWDLEQVNKTYGKW